MSMKRLIARLEEAVEDKASSKYKSFMVFLFPWDGRRTEMIGRYQGPSLDAAIQAAKKAKREGEDSVAGGVSDGFEIEMMAWPFDIGKGTDWNYDGAKIIYSLDYKGRRNTDKNPNRMWNAKTQDYSMNIKV